MANIKPISGTNGKLWLDGELVALIDSFEAKVTAKREEYQDGMDMDSKIVGLEGKGTIKFKKVYTMGKKKLLDAWKKGEDPRSKIVASLKDAGTKNKQSERVSIDNVWFDELTLMQFEKGKLIDEELPFGFTPSDADYLDIIEK